MCGIFLWRNSESKKKLYYCPKKTPLQEDILYQQGFKRPIVVYLDCSCGEGRNTLEMDHFVHLSMLRDKHISKQYFQDLTFCCQIESSLFNTF